MEPIRPPLSTPQGRARRFTNYNRAMTPRNNYDQYPNATPTINIFYPPNYGYFRPQFSQIVVSNPYFNYQPYRYQLMPPPNYYLLNQGFSPYMLPSIHQVKPPQQKKSPKNKKRTKFDESDSSEYSSSYESSSYNSSSSSETQSTLSTTSSSSRLSESSSSSTTKSSSSSSMSTSSSIILPHLKKTTTKTESDTDTEIIVSISSGLNSTSRSNSNDDSSISSGSLKPPPHPRARIAINRNSDRKSSADRKSDSDSETETLKSTRRLADQGDTNALFRLGSFYMYGEGGVEEDKQQALRYLQQAAEQGHGDAQLYSGILLMMGDGVEEDREKGREWLEKAAAQGISDAVELLESESFSGFSSDLSSSMDGHLKLSRLFGGNGSGTNSTSYSESDTDFTFL